MCNPWPKKKPLMVYDFWDLHVQLCIDVLGTDRTVRVTRFICRPDHRLAWLIFFVFLSFYRKKAGILHQICQNQFRLKIRCCINSAVKTLVNLLPQYHKHGSGANFQNGNDTSGTYCMARNFILHLFFFKTCNFLKEFLFIETNKAVTQIFFRFPFDRDN